MSEPSEDGEVGGGPVPPAAPSQAMAANCVWCGRPFAPRRTGGSAQRFCSTGHRHAFWIAARRWTMRAIETGPVWVDCLRAPQTIVHAETEGIASGWRWFDVDLEKRVLHVRQRADRWGSIGKPKSFSGNAPSRSRRWS